MNPLMTGEKKQTEENVGKGRPSLYKPDYCLDLINYFKTEPNKEVLKEWVDKKGQLHVNKEVQVNKLPTFIGFADSINVNHDTLFEWAKVHPDFSDSMKVAREYQKFFLIENGLRGHYNPSFAIFTAKNLTDMRDKQEIEHTGNLALTLAESIGMLETTSFPSTVEVIDESTGELSLPEANKDNKE